MSRRRGRSPVLVGAIVLLLVGAFTVFVFTGFNPFHRGYEVNAVFTSALSNGIKSGTPVRVAGVNVGIVKSVEHAPGNLVEATLEIRDLGRPIHADATIKARPRILLEGNYFLDVRPGTPRSGELRDGGTIPVTQTAIPVQFDQVVDTFTADTRTSNRRLLTGLAKSVEGDGAEALRDSYRALPGALREGAVTFEALRGSGDRDLAAFIRDQARLSGTLSDSSAQLDTLLATYRTTLDALARRQVSLRASVPALERLLTSAPDSLRRVRSALPAVRTFAAAARPALEVAPPVLDHANGFVAELRTLMGADRLDRIITELGPVSARLLELERSLPGLLGLVDRVSGCVRDKVLPVLNTQVDDGHLSTKQPVWQDLIHGAQGLLSSQQNFGGDGYSTRFGFGVDQNVVATRAGLGNELVQLTGTPQLGARPRWTPGRQPPYRPDVPCETQPVQSTKAETVEAPKPFATVRLKSTEGWTADKLREQLEAALDRVKKQR